jgi:hypothetical protein
MWFGSFCPGCTFPLASNIIVAVILCVSMVGVLARLGGRAFGLVGLWHYREVVWHCHGLHRFNSESCGGLCAVSNY